jgi:hypothetical protein
MKPSITRSSRQTGGAGTGVLLFVALLEIALAIFLFLWWRAGVCQPPLPAAIQRALLGSRAGGQIGGNLNGGPSQEQGSQTQAQSIATSVPQGRDSSTGAAAQDAGSNTSGGNTSGSLNDVPDPNCVGKTTASLLSSGSSTPPPTCAPMKAPAQLQQAAAQVQNMNGATNAQSQPAGSPTP